MSKITFDINDFRTGVIGSKTLGSGTPATTMEGFLAMDDAMILGTSLTKRSPLRYLARIVDNTPRNVQFLSYGDNVFYAIGQTRAFTIKDGKNIDVLPDIYKVTAYEERNNYDVVTFDKTIDLTKGEFVVGYINEYPTDVYSISLVSGTTYLFDSLTEQKSNKLEWITHVKQVVITNVSVADYVDFAGGTYVTGSKTDGFSISLDGVITANNIRADSISLYGTRTVTGTSGDLAVAGSAINISIGGNPTFNLAPEFGQVLYWLRTIYRGLVVSTNTGVFYMRINGAEAELSIIDGKTTSKVKPVAYRSFLIYADSSGESVSYVRIDPLSAVAYSADLTSDNDIFLGHGGVKKLLVYYANNMAYLLCLMNDGSCIAGQLIENQRDYSLGISLMRWFYDYKVYDIALYKQGSLENILILSVLYLDYASILTTTFVAPPSFVDDKIRSPFLDFYRDISTKEIFPAQVDIFFYRKDITDTTFYATTKTDYFSNMFLNARIKSDASFIVLNVIDARNAVCEISGSVLAGNDYLAKANTYIIEIGQYTGLNHLFAIYSKNRAMKFYSRSDGKDNVCKIEYDGSVISFDYGSNITIGVKYSMYVHTGPILPAGQSSLSRAGSYGNAEITVHTIGHYSAEISVGFYKKNGKDFDFHKAQTYRDDGFFRSMRVSGVSPVSNSLKFSLLSDSTAQAFITCISVDVNHGKS